MLPLHTRQPLVGHARAKRFDDGGAQVDSVYFPQHEVVGDIGNGIWQLKERLKEHPLPKWDLRCASLAGDAGIAGSRAGKSVLCIGLHEANMSVSYV